MGLAFAPLIASWLCEKPRDASENVVHGEFGHGLKGALT